MASKLKHSPREGILHPQWLLAIRALVLVAFGISSYLLVVSLQGMRAVGCGPDSGCDKVLHSRWAYWFNIPVSLFALATYFTIFAITFRLQKNTPVPQQRKAWSVLIPCSVLVIGAALWFVVLQFFIIRSICPYCMTAHICGLAAGMLILMGAPFGAEPEKPWQREKQVYVTRGLARNYCLGALAALTVFIGGQAAHQKNTYSVTAIPDSTQSVALSRTDARLPALPAVQTNRLPATANASTSKNDYTFPNTPWLTAKPGTNPPLTVVPGVFAAYGQVPLDLKNVPIIGSSSAPHLILSLYDYTCHNCQEMHKPLVDIQRIFSNEVAIVSLPMPLDPACNKAVRRAQGPHTNACQYARLGLTVWRANPARMREFDDWVFASNPPPPVERVRQFASDLVGSLPFEQAALDPWIEQQLQLDVGIYEIAKNQYHQAAMPQIIIGKKVVVGTMDRKEVIRIVAEQFQLPLPAQF